MKTIALVTATVPSHQQAAELEVELGVRITWHNSRHCDPSMFSPVHYDGIITDNPTLAIGMSRQITESDHYILGTLFNGQITLHALYSSDPLSHFSELSTLPFSV